MILLQIRFYDQQDSLSLLENNNGDNTRDNADIGLSSYVIYDKYSPAGKDYPVTIMMATQVYS